MIEKVKMGFADTAKSFMIDMWLARQSQEKVLPLLHKVIEGAKDEFADAVANGDGVYAVGYCFGGKYVLLLGSEHPDAVAKGQAVKDEEQGVVKSGPQIKAGAIAHGKNPYVKRGCNLTRSRNPNYEGGYRGPEGTCDHGLYWYDDTLSMLYPSALLSPRFLWSEVDGGAENDPLFPDDIRAEGQKYLVDNNIPHEIQIFPGVPHGQYPRVTEGSKLQLILE